MPDQISNLSEKILHSPAFQDRFQLLQKFAGKKRLAFDGPSLNQENIDKLILQASILALSYRVSDKRVAQKINALLNEIIPDQALVNFAVQIISSRLGNFPVISEASKVFGDASLFKQLNDNIELINSYDFDSEIIGNLFNEEDQSRLRIKDKIFHFNVFQKEIMDALDNKSLVSFSAPTSFGKSFIVRYHIAKLYAEQHLGRTLVIVPTKSLIDDFFEGLSKIKHNLGLDFGIYTHARSVQTEQERSVFILTQERLSFLLTKNPEFLRTFQLVYCDEAHYISRGYRGFVLKDVLQKIVALCGIQGLGGNTKYIFSSPLIKNPQYYKEKVFPSLPVEQSFHKEVTYSPVEKNIQFIAKDLGSFKYYLLRDSINEDGFDSRLEEMGSRTFPESLQSAEVGNKIARDIYVALNSNLSGQTILYTTNPLSAHQYALMLASQLGEIEQITPQEINDLSKYIKDHYDDSFGLVELLKKGVGLHYGPMPVGLRRAIVDLFEQGTIKYLVCTSTLLEGVNLPAKNIFVFSDKQGGRGKHSALSFWNLVGRAGRLTFGLSGNVYCTADSTDHYKNLIENLDSEINDPEVEIVENKTRQSYIIKSFLVAEEKFKYTRAKNRNDIEYLIFELLTREDPSPLLRSFSMDDAQKNQLLGAISEQKELLTIPLNLVRKNLGIDPRLQDGLYNFLSEKSQAEIQSLLEIVSGGISTTAAELTPTLTLTKEKLMWPSEKSMERIANRLTQWLMEMPISGFIQQALKHLEPATNQELFLKRVTAAIRIIGFLDEELSYNTPKYLKCFFDITIYIARLKGIENLEIVNEKVESYLFSLESGISSLIGRFLFEKGVSRPVAIRTNVLVNDLAAIPISADFFDKPEVLERLRAGLSKVAFQELRDHISM